MKAPVVALTNSIQGKGIPMLGLGTLRSGKDEVRNAVTSAIRQGYRLIDCAEVYGNETEVGDALKEIIHEGVVKREELFIVGKVFNNHHHIPGESRVREACEASVKALGGAIDLYLMHWPFKFEDSNLPKEGLRLSDGSGRPRPEIQISCEFLETWSEMEKLKDAGLVKAIGVSNFTQPQLETLLQNCKQKPCANQVEFHPYLFQKSLAEYCKSTGIQLIAYSPLGAGAPAGGHSLLEHPTVTALAAKHGKSAAQVLVRWSIQLGNVCIPKSTNAIRIGQNLDVFSWELSAADMAELAGLNLGHRFTRGFMEEQWFDVGEIRYSEEELHAAGLKSRL